MPCNCYKVKQSKRGIPLTALEEQFILENKDELSLRCMGKRLDRSTSAVKRFLRRHKC